MNPKTRQLATWFTLAIPFVIWTALASKWEACGAAPAFPILATIDCWSRRPFALVIAWMFLVAVITSYGALARKAVKESRPSIAIIADIVLIGGVLLAGYGFIAIEFFDWRGFSPN